MGTSLIINSMCIGNFGNIQNLHYLCLFILMKLVLTWCEHFQKITNLPSHLEKRKWKIRENKAFIDDSCEFTSFGGRTISNVLNSKFPYKFHYRMDFS